MMLTIIFAMVGGAKFRIQALVGREILPGAPGDAWKRPEARENAQGYTR